jgi:mannose/fructose/N-acetylgalactosamine-specific phosphotransferase system component IIB
LIHGQVVIGWGSHLFPHRYLVIDDSVAVSDWEQELYALGLPDGAEAQFLSADDARQQMAAWHADRTRTVILVRDIHTLFRLATDDGLIGLPVNLGGIHHGPGRVQVLSYLYLDEDDRRRLRELETMGIKVSARDLPGSKEVALGRLLA